MGFSSRQVLRAWNCHRQPIKKQLSIFSDRANRDLPPRTHSLFSNERHEAPSPKYCSCKIRLYQGFFEFSKISIVGGLTPSFYVVFLWRLRITRLESHNSKQMMVYEQITFFIKNLNFPIVFGSKNRIFDGKIEFWIKKPKKNLE